MNLRKISFPVYQVTKPVSRFGTKLVFLNAKEEEVILDDSSVEGSTLGLRRLHIKGNLLPLNQAIYFIKDLVKLSGTFIDNVGYLFTYSKSRLVPLIFKRITKVLPIKTGGAILEIDNEYPRYKIMYAPKLEEQYIGLLEISPKAYLIYGLYTEVHKDTRRKV